MALERTMAKAKADVIQAKAKLEAKKAEFARQEDKLIKTEEQIKKTKIHAPAEGLVIYATSAKRHGKRRTVEPLQEGQQVQERQELIYLPTSSSAMAQVGIHEASFDKVRIGLPAKITVDALPGETFMGRVAKIAPLPDAHAAWLNPDLTIYNTDIHLDGSNRSLRTGMSCKAEIIIKQYQDATYIPVQAVLRVNGEPTVYVVNDKTLEPRKVEIGFDNNTMVRIIRGLEPGEVVSLTPPLAAAAVEPAIEEIVIDTGPGTVSTKPAPDPSERVKVRESGEPRSPSKGNLISKKRKSKERMREILQSMSPEEREAYRNMPREERRKMREDLLSRHQEMGVD